MQTTRKKLLVTLVLMTVAVASVWPTLASAAVSVRGTSGGPVGRPIGMYTAGEPEQPGNSAPTPSIVVVHLTAQPGHGNPHSRMVPMNVLFMWIGRIWAAQYGVTP